jgi:hypothetical protein
MQKRITDSFVRGIDGRWTCTEPVKLDHPAGTLKFNHGAVFGPGDTYRGIKVAMWLDCLIESRRAGSTEKRRS